MADRRSGDDQDGWNAVAELHHRPQGCSEFRPPAETSPNLTQYSGPSTQGNLPKPGWGPERLAKVERNYSMAYVRSILPELCAVLGPAEAAALGRVAGRQIGMQYHQMVMAPFDGSVPFAPRFASLLAAHGRSIQVDDPSTELGGVP